MAQSPQYIELCRLSQLARDLCDERLHVYIYGYEPPRFSIYRNNHALSHGVPFREAREMILNYIPAHHRPEKRRKRTR